MCPTTSSQVALITGSTRGIGRDTARQLAEQGLQVYVSGRDAATAADVATELGVDAIDAPLDIASPDSIDAYAERFTNEVGRLDVLVNNAAAYVDWSETTSGADLDESRRVLDTNLFGTWRTTQAFLPLLRNSASPRIVCVSSGAGSHGEPNFGLTARNGAAASYGISKAALNALVSSLAAELGEPFLVNAAEPGLTATFDGAEHMGARPVEDGAASIVWAATLPAHGPTGGFYRDGEPLPW